MLSLTLWYNCWLQGPVKINSTPVKILNDYVWEGCVFENVLHPHVLLLSYKNAQYNYYKQFTRLNLCRYYLF